MSRLKVSGRRVSLWPGCEHAGSGLGQTRLSKIFLFSFTVMASARPSFKEQGGSEAACGKCYLTAAPLLL